MVKEKLARQWRNIFFVTGPLLALLAASILPNGCAQIGATTGGPRDTLAPVLMRANPEPRTTFFSGNRITLVFDEYVQLKEPQNNVLISPFQKSQPTVTSNLKTVSIKLRDSLQPNSTYTIQFGDAIQDINENNPLKDFTYVFSTGSYLDSMTLRGKVILAETGLPDSTISVLLYRNLADSAVKKLKPDYVARLKGDGSFQFLNLPPGTFNVYALKDGDGNTSYTISTELFAFLNAPVKVDSSSQALQLFAYAQEKADENKKIKILKSPAEKVLKYEAPTAGTQDLQDTFRIKFNNPLNKIDTAQLVLRDTNFVAVAGGSPIIDSTRKIIAYKPHWQAGGHYRILVTKETVEDSVGHKLSKADTIRIRAKEVTEYGRVLLRFKNFDSSLNPVLQLMTGNTVKYSSAITGGEWSNDMILPGEYELRILYDDNQDGKWTPGNYDEKRQPEKAITLPQKLSIRADWDNERDVSL